jgi:hypothetical protein
VKSPVMQALVSAELAEAEKNAHAVDATVANWLGPPPDYSPARLPAEFLTWCERRDVRPVPARPGSVALFLLEHESLGIEALARMVSAISQVHLKEGRADPASGYPVATALNSLAKIDAPRSWPKEHKGRFTSLPYDLQAYVSAHEAQREKELRRAHNEAATARKQLAAIQQPAQKESSDGITQPAA